MVDNRIFIYSGNHGKPDGIEDYLMIFENVLGSKGFQIEVSNQLHENAINIIIDEFTNYSENKKIIAFRKDNPNNICIFVLTEFVEKKFGVESFNNFGGIFDAASIALINVYLRLKRDDFPSVRLKDFVLLLLFSPILGAYFLADYIKYKALRLFRKNAVHPVGNFLKKQYSLFYFHMRYLGLKTLLKYADAIITSHEFIIQGYEKFDINGKKLNFLGVIYSEFNKNQVLDSLMIGKKLYIEITGSITLYRQNFLNTINYYISLMGLNKVFGLCKALPFSFLKEKVNRAAYSLHPPQTPDWKYCSPTRIYRAVAIEHNLPILTKHFSQNPIEDVCLIMENHYSLIKMIEMYFNRQIMLDFIEPRIETYNNIVKQRNAIIVKSLKAIGSK
ncbi:MAG: hypothetical protein HQK79_23195 [Desulfobacterales bacterium]|nr:hypothetical protein [Desulfobacterales bacterium]MBF0396167.1 hypothetical protein [Desulfobacterales bacterium]